MNEQQIRELSVYLERRIAVQKELLNSSKKEESYHLGAIMELLGMEERLLLILNKKQP
jgi:hypothetical protein